MSWIGKGSPIIVIVVALFLAPAICQAEPDLWNQLEQLADNANYKVKFDANKPSFKVGDKLTLTIRVEKPGHINVLSLGRGEDKSVVLFPNQYNQDNKIGPGEIVIPGPNDKFDLKAGEPAGDNLIVVFQTEKNINAFL